MRNRILNLWWQVVKVFHRRSYLKHRVDSDPEHNDWEAIDDYLYFETQHWLKRADRVHVGIADLHVPDPQEVWGETYDGFRRLKWEPLRCFKKAVEDAEYERKRRKREGREFWIKWVTAVTAGIAAAASVLNVYLTWQYR